MAITVGCRSGEREKRVGTATVPNRDRSGDFPAPTTSQRRRLPSADD
ncbi:hypothetical protein NGM10_05065 [Halorussus salilacus]|nr:hypothetical protein [Halorussus salilacus]USZ69109.1 hypothetical protein NGM10_05065 [Halorussus salilacus]